VAGNGLVVFAGFSASVFSSLVAELLLVVLFHTLLNAFQILFDAPLRIADRWQCQFHLAEIVSIKTLNITLGAAGHRFLRLHYFEVVGNACGETILRLLECLFGQVDGNWRRHGHLVGRSIQVQKGDSNLIINAAAEIPQLRARRFNCASASSTSLCVRLPPKIGY